MKKSKAMNLFNYGILLMLLIMAGCNRTEKGADVPTAVPTNVVSPTVTQIVVPTSTPTPIPTLTLTLTHNS